MVFLRQSSPPVGTWSHHKEAQALLAKSLYDGIITFQTFKVAYDLYFERAVTLPDQYPDCAPRTVWSLHNVPTRAFKLPLQTFSSTEQSRIARIGFGMKNKANLEETMAICDQLRILVVDIFKRKEIKKGDRGKWRNKARRLLRQISESI